MNLSTLTQKLTDLISDRDQVQRQIDGVIDELNSFRSSGGGSTSPAAEQSEAPIRRKPGPKPGGARRGRKPGALKPGPKPRAQGAAPTNGRRGPKTRGAGDRIIEILKRGGRSGVPVADIADRLGKKKETIHVWLYTSGKKFNELEKIGKGLWRWNG